MLSDGKYKEGKVVEGQIVKEEELGSMYVWIPRYAYRIVGEKNIEVNFLKGNTNQDKDGKEYTEDESTDTKTTPIVHPAFRLAGGQLSGIWVSKFEASGTNKDGNAVAYLCYSQYGNVPKINGAGSLVENNHWYDYYTGQGPASASSEGWYNKTDDTHNYNTSNGMLASTTGNITGIYDMNGGCWERVAGYLDNGNWSLNGYGQSADGSIKYFENGKINSTYASLWDSYEVSEEEKTNKISLGDGTTLTQGELWDWNKKEEKHHEARRITESTYNNMSNHKGIGVNEVSTDFSFYAPYVAKDDSKPWGWFKTVQEAVKGTSNYARAWDNDFVLIGHSACPFVVRGGGCFYGSGAGVLLSDIYINDICLN